jgi:choline dehydrogenase-like flavoprotein
VIGGGTAGSVIANRLSEIGEWSVLLLEAGGDEAIFGQIPANAAGLQLTPYDWQYKTTEQASGACHGSVNKQ